MAITHLHQEGSSWPYTTLVKQSFISLRLCLCKNFIFCACLLFHFVLISCDVKNLMLEQSSLQK